MRVTRGTKVLSKRVCISAVLFALLFTACAVKP